MKMFLNITIFLTPIISFLFTIVAFYMGSNHIPHLYAGGLIYLISSIFLLILSWLYAKRIHSIWLNIAVSAVYILYGYSALIFSLIVWYDMPAGYLNSLSNTLFTVSIMIMSLALIFIDKKIKINTFSSIFWILILSSTLFVGILSPMIHVYNSPDKVSHVLYGSVIYFSIAIVLFAFTFFISLYSNKPILLSTILGSLAFLWIGLKLVCPIIVKLSDKSSILIFGISILMVLLVVKQNTMKILSRNKYE